MKFRTSFGPVPVEEFERAIVAPFGEATKILRKYDPLFGRDLGDVPTKKFKCEVRKKVYRIDTAEVVIEAVDEEDARQIVSDMEESRFSWDEGWDEDEDDYEIESIEEIEK